MFAKSLSTFLNVIAGPKEAFETVITEKLSFWIPLILVIILALVATHYLYDPIMEMEITKMEYNPDIPEDQADMAATQMEKITEPPLRYVFSIAMPILGTFIGLAIYALFYMLMGNFVFGGKGSFGDLFTIAVYASAVSVVEIFAQLGIFFATGNFTIFNAAALMLPLSEFYTTTYTLLSAIDIFKLWYLFVVGFGIKALYKFDTVKAMAVPFGLYLAWIVVTNGFKAIF